MPSASQIRSDNLARQAVLSAASPLKLFASQSTDSAAQTTAAFSSFEDALTAARRPDPLTTSAQNATTSASTTDDTQSADESDSQDQDDDSVSDAKPEDAPQSQRTTSHNDKKVNSRKLQKPSSASVNTDSAPSTAAAASTDPATPSAPTPKIEKKPTPPTTAGPTASPQVSATSPDAANLAAQQLAANTAHPVPTKPTAPKPQSTGTDESTIPTDNQSPAQAHPLAKPAAQTPANPAAEKATSPLVAETSSNRDQQKQSSTPQDNSDLQNPSAPRAPQLQSPLNPTLKPALTSDTQTTAAPAAQSTTTAQPTPANLDPLAQSLADSTNAAITAPTLTPDQGPFKPSANTTTLITDGPSNSLQNISTEGADAAATAQQPPEIDPEQTFQQVVAGLRGKMDPTSGKAEISLNPPNLGTLHVSISLSNGSLTAQFQSSSDVVRDLLKTNMEKLKTVLEGQGIAVDKLAVEAPAGKVVAETAKTSTPNSPNNDGRSAGQYTRDQSNPKRSQGSQSFARFRQGNANGASTQEAPIDVVG